MNFCTLRFRRTASSRLTKSRSALRAQHQECQGRLPPRGHEQYRRARPSQARQSLALVLGYSGGNVVSRLKMLCRILVRHRFLLSAGLSAAAGIILKTAVLIPVADPLFRYAAFQRPSIYDAFVWSFAIFLFPTPSLFLSLSFSLLYIHFHHYQTPDTSG